MKIIELLTLIANGEEVPKKIKYDDDIYIHVDNYCYYCQETNEILSQNIYAEFSRLNDEVSIIEEEKEIRKLPNEIQQPRNFEEVVYIVEDLVRKINQIIDVINDMRDKE